MVKYHLYWKKRNNHWKTISFGSLNEILSFARHLRYFRKYTGAHSINWNSVVYNPSKTGMI